MIRKAPRRSSLDGSRGSFSILGLLDPLNGPQGPYNLAQDTSHLLLWEFARRGHAIHVAAPSDLSGKGKKVAVRARRATVLAQKPYFRLSRPSTMRADAFDLILMRKDPPVDRAYLGAARLLKRVKEPTWVSNRPASLIRWNEKLVIFRFPRWIPPTLVTRSVRAIRKFATQHRERVVLKSLSSFGGKGVALADLQDPRFDRIARKATNGGKIRVMVQTFLEKIHEGEKRIFLIDGRPLGALKRIPPRGGFLSNPDLGAKLKKTRLTPREKRLCADLAPFLKRHGIFFAGVDVIGEKLTEINITSPGMLWEWNGVDKAHHERQIVALYEKKLRES